MKPSLYARLAFCLPLLAYAAPKSGLDLANFDPKVRIQDDLYMAANGTWQKQNGIPDDQATWGIGDQLVEKSEERVRDLLLRATQDNKDDVDAQKLSDFYASYMDEATIAKLGLAPLRGKLDDIAALQTHEQVFAAFGSLEVIGVAVPVVAGASADAKDSGHYALYMTQAGLGLPSRDYYLDQDPRFAKTRTAYRAYLTKLFALAGMPDGPARADAVIALETRLARIQWTETENRDDKKTYNKLGPAQLAQLGKGLPWDQLLAKADVEQGLHSLIVQQPSYIRKLPAIVRGTPVAVWRDYLSLHLLDEYARALPSDFVDARFAFHGKELNGSQTMTPRWKRAVETVNDGMGEAAGRLYVAKYFPPSSKARIEALVGNLLKAYNESIDSITWMSAATKAQAHEKLAHYTVKIGYPSAWRDYSQLVIKPDDLVGNLMRSQTFEYHRQIVRVGRTVDRSEWSMTPQTVNAYYEPTANEIVFPAAILQAPYFDPDADDAANYGATGSTIGHEISHGFDDEGALYDGFGNMHNWWTKRDTTAFNKLTSRLVAQFNHYQPVPGRRVNGKLTLGENIADLSGLQIAYRAYHLSLNGKPAEVIDGFTGDQRFFLSYAQSWNSKMRDELTLQMLSVDPHSPDRFRANGAVENCDGFHEAFNTKPGDAMYKKPEDRIHIW